MGKSHFKLHKLQIANPEIYMTQPSLIFLFLVGAAAAANNLVSDRIGAKNCTGTDGCCRIDEGDCDSNNDCCSGLLCNYDWGFKTDLCEAGPTTKDFSWANWDEWSACSVSCGMIGVRSRSRNCVGPVNGGRDCPKKTDKQWESCGEPCWTDYTEWTSCKGICGEVGHQTRSRSCTSGVGVKCPEESVETQTRDCDTIGLLI